MSEKENINLTLDEGLEIPAVPTLTLETEEEPAPVVEEVKPAAEPVVLDESSLTEEEKKVVNDFAEKIDVSNTNMILQYGAAAQKKVASFSESALANVRTKDMGEIGDMIADLVVELKGFNVDENAGFFKRLFSRAANSVSSLKARYDKAETNVDKIVDVLEGHQVQLLKDVAMLDKMYDMNLAYFKELSMYIIAGKKKLEKVRATELVALREKAEKSGLPEDAQAANDFEQMCNRFEKKIHDLELTRIVSLQMSPQIRLVQNNDTLMSEKIQSTIVNTIPLWKSQMVLALGIAHSQAAMEAQRAVSDMTNDLLKKNADKLKMSTIGNAKESERGIVDLETLKYTNQQLISTLDEVLKIQNDGRAKRRAAEVELGRIEGELKQKLLEIRK